MYTDTLECDNTTYVFPKFLTLTVSQSTFAWKLSGVTPDEELGDYCLNVSVWDQNNRSSSYLHIIKV